MKVDGSNLRQELATDGAIPGELEELERENLALRERVEQLETANAELEAFNYSVSHDLRLPLSLISGYCQMLQRQAEERGPELGAEWSEYLECIQRATLNMEGLINSLLEFSRCACSELNIQPVNLTVMAQSVAADLMAAEPGRPVEFRVEEGLSARCDGGLLQVALENLLGNAWKYTGARERAVVEFGACRAEGGSAFFVRDNGTGFDMADAGRLFVPFQRLNNSDPFRGKGIGLATVARIVQRHGGRIWAESEPDRGATFYFTLCGDP